MKTADLIDGHADELSFIHLPFRQYGLKPYIAAQVQTVIFYEDKSAIRSELEKLGHGRILVVDGGASTSVALLGDVLANLAILNGWAVMVINGATRDSREISQTSILVFAIATSPMKSAKRGWGETGKTVTIGGVFIKPNDWI